MRTTGSREVYRNPWIRVREDAVERADGSAGVYSVVEKPHFALVLPHELQVAAVPGRRPPTRTILQGHLSLKAGFRQRSWPAVCSRHRTLKGNTARPGIDRRR